MTKHKGQLVSLPAVFISALVALIIMFSVLLPITNTVLAGNSTTGNVWNNTGYGTALGVAQSIPLLFVLVAFIAIAIVVVGVFKTM